MGEARDLDHQTANRRTKLQPAFAAAARGNPPTAPHAAVLALQRMAGNLAVTSLARGLGGDNPRSAPFSLSGTSRGRPQISEHANPGRLVIQRDLVGQYPIPDGSFMAMFQAFSEPGGVNGMFGNITFTPTDLAPDSKSIRLLQVLRLEDLRTNQDYVWTGDEANRNSMMTAKGEDVHPGYFVDHSAGRFSPRKEKNDKLVPPYYREYFPKDSRDGAKNGKSIMPASLSDQPQSGRKVRYTFETAALAADTGYAYGSLQWGFTISDPAKGVVDNEQMLAVEVPSKTFRAALAAFDKFYKNPRSAAARAK